MYLGAVFSAPSPSPSSSSPSHSSLPSASLSRAFVKALLKRNLLISELLPTPLGPAKTVVLSFNAASSSSTPSPVATDIIFASYPQPSNRARQSATSNSLNNSHLFNTSVKGTCVASMLTKNLVSCFASSGGCSSANTNNA